MLLTMYKKIAQLWTIFGTSLIYFFRVLEKLAYKNPNRFLTFFGKLADIEKRRGDIYGD